MPPSQCLLAAVTVCLLLPGALLAQEGDRKSGRVKAASCAACHGNSGISVNDLWPNLAGQNDAYLAKQLRDFRDGSRKDPIMSTFAQGLSDQDIADLAAYYASLEWGAGRQAGEWYEQRKEQKSY